MSENLEQKPTDKSVKLVLDPHLPLQDQMDAYYKKSAQEELEKKLLKLANDRTNNQAQ